MSVGWFGWRLGLIKYINDLYPKTFMGNQKLRDRGYELIRQGCFLGDTSGKTKSLKEKSVFGLCSKKAEYSVKFEASEKERVFKKMQKKYKKYGPEKIKTIMHAVSIYFAVKGYIKTAPKFFICSEGFHPRVLIQEVKTLLDSDYDSKKFEFKSLKARFGKYNMADKLASAVRNGKKRRNLLLEESQFKKLKLI